MAKIPARSQEESRATKYLAVFTLTPILCFAFQDLGSEYGGLDWLTYGYAAWPMMIAPVLILLLFIKKRDLAGDPQNGGNFSQTSKMVSLLFLIPNLFAALGYSWLAWISVLSTLIILVLGRRLKKQARV
ncbi:hypothetical protein ACIPSE_06585 [Streptomyces sp. NPDC090106]|uniref:hypothetical protein n=1 Tax=Streptomyces sp. NPDC090106 TaxID=3365946 RepID=UPI00380E1E54